MYRIVVFLIAALASNVTYAATGDRIALVVGNSGYQNTPALANPKNDATKIAAALQSLDFEVMLITDASQREFGDALLSFERKIDGASHALFFYAGHGMQLRGENYLLSVDAKVRNQHLIDSEAVRLSHVLGIMEARAETSIAFIDACRDNPLANALRDQLPDQARSLGLGRGLALISGAYRDSLVAFATTPGDIAYDGTGQNSPFTKALLNHIDTSGIEVSTMLKRVSADVLETTEGKQRPEVVSQMSREFYFRLSVGTVEARPSTLDNESMATQQLNLAVGIQDTKSRLAAIESVAKTFPDTSAASIARQLADQLNSKPVEDGIQPYPSSRKADSEGDETEIASVDPSKELTAVKTAPNDFEIGEVALGIGRSNYRTVQLALQEAGFSPGAADGLFGPRSRTALRRFEAANGLSQTGYLNKSTYSKLLALAPKIEVETADTSSAIPVETTPQFDGTYEVVVRRRWDDEYAKYHHDPYYKPGRQETLAVFRFNRNGRDELSLTSQRDFTGTMQEGFPRMKASLDEDGNFKFRVTMSSHFGSRELKQVTFTRKFVSFEPGQSTRFEPGRFDQQFIKNVELKRLR